MSALPLCLRPAQVCAPRSWTGFNQTIFLGWGNERSFFVPLSVSFSELLALIIHRFCLTVHMLEEASNICLTQEKNEILQAVKYKPVSYLFKPAQPK